MSPASERRTDPPPRSRRPRVARIGLLGAASLALGGCSDPPPPPVPRPDVLLVSLDTLRADRLSCYGHERATTPNLDALAAAGVRFAEAHAPSANTAPSHMSVFTGLDPLAHGVRPVNLGNQDVPRLSEEVKTLPELLRGGGYHTVGLCDNGYLLPQMGFRRGFSHYHNGRESLADKIERLDEVLGQAPAEAPLFVFFHTYAIHAPYLPPKPFYGRYHDAEYRGEFRRRYRALAGLEAKEAWAQKSHFLDPFEGMGEADRRFLSDLYDEGVAYADSLFDDLLGVWENHRDPDQRLTVVFSDHGEGFLEHGKFGHQYDLYRELVLVPLLIQGPGARPGVVETPVSLTDLLPTLLERLDLPAGDLQGESFLAMLEDPEREHPERVVVSQLNTRRGLNDSWRAGELRILRQVREEDPGLRVFDWASDASEARDLAVEDGAPDVSGLVEGLEGRRLDGLRHQHERPSGAGGSLSEEDFQQLQALGYLGSDQD